MKQPTAILSEVVLSWAIFIPAIWLSFPPAHALKPYPNLHFVIWIIGLFFGLLLTYPDKIIYRYFGTNQRILKTRISKVHNCVNQSWQQITLGALVTASDVFNPTGLIGFLMLRYWFLSSNNLSWSGASTFSGFLFGISIASVMVFLFWFIWLLSWSLIKRGFHNLRAHNL